MKLPFRFFRGEFSGKYLYAVLTCFNKAVKDILDELAYHASMAWKTEAEIEGGESHIRDEDLFNIGKIAGLYSDSLLGRTNTGSVAFSESFIENGKQRSERALMDMNAGTNRYVRTAFDEYPDDIVNEASSELRMSLIPEGATPVGYAVEGTPIFNEDGSVIWENLRYEPPDDGTPYVPFYGESFLVHEETFVKEQPLSPGTFKILFECLMKIRRNGPSLGIFFDVTQALTTGIVTDLEIVLDPGRYYMVYYSLDRRSTVYDQDRLVACWLWLIRDKFKLFVPELRVVD